MRWKHFEESLTELLVTLASLALGWGLALLLSKGVSFAWPAAGALHRTGGKSCWP